MLGNSACELTSLLVKETLTSPSRVLLIAVSRRPGRTKVRFPTVVFLRLVVAFVSGSIFLTPSSLSTFTAWYRVSVQASVPERGEGAGQEGPGESHGAAGSAHLLTVTA